MSVSRLRTIICGGMLVIMPASVPAQDSGAAMLYGKGIVLLNGNPLPNSSAVLPGDVVQTQSDSAATINASGSNIIVQPDSLVKFDANTISLEQGSMSVATSRGLIASAAGVTASPASGVWTEIEVSEVNGKVQVLSRKGDVAVNCGKDSTNLAAGEQVTSDGTGKCDKRRRKAGAYPPASGEILNNPYFKYAAAGAGIGVLIWLLWPTPGSPASPSIP